MLITTQPMPVFWEDQARAQLGEERFATARRDPLDIDLLAWNIFQSLQTHYDQDWLAYRLQQFGGTGVVAPVRLQMWTGTHEDATLQPSRGYLAAVKERAVAAGATDADLAGFRAPIEVPIRIESPDVLCLVQTTMDTPVRGTNGRDRLLELIDAGLEQARQLSKTLAVAAIYRAGSAAADSVSTRMEHLRTSLPSELPHQPRAGSVQLREVTWQQLLRVWESEVDYLDIPGSHKPFLQHVKRAGLY